MMERRKFLRGAAAAILGTAWSDMAGAQSWPARAMTWIYPYAAGGGGDPVARLIAVPIGRKLGQTIVIENRTGAAGMIGAGAVARSAADGYTFLFGVSGEIAINQWLYKKMPYDPDKDFAPVCRIVTLPLLLVANAATGIRSVDDLIARAKAPDNKLTYGSPGKGTLQHLATELLQHTAGIQITHVPYRGIAAVMNDLLAGTVDVAFVGLPTALPFVHNGRLNALGLSSATRIASEPDLVPLSASAALKNFNLTQWFGLLAPAGTPTEIIDKMYQTVASVMQDSEIKARLSAQGAEPAVDTPEQFGAFIRDERKRFAGIIHDARISLD